MRAFEVHLKGVLVRWSYFDYQTVDAPCQVEAPSYISSLATGTNIQYGYNSWP